MKCLTTLKKLGQLEVLFSTVSLYFHPSSLKMRAVHPYGIYVFGKNKNWEILCKRFDEIDLKSNILVSFRISVTQ